VALNSGELLASCNHAGTTHLPLLYICRHLLGNSSSSPAICSSVIHEPERGRIINEVQDAVRGVLDVEVVAEVTA
jgi:hypothetical protein